MIFIGIIVLINFLIWLFFAILWNNILSKEYKREIAYKNAGIEMPEEPVIPGDTPEERIDSLFQNKQVQVDLKNEFNVVHTHDQNTRLAIAIWGLISILLGLLMIWMLDLVPFLFSLIRNYTNL